MNRPCHARLRRRSAAGLAIVVALLGAGCDSEPQAAESTPTQTAEPAETASPTDQPTSAATEEPTPLSPPDDPEPDLATTGEDLEAVVKSLHAYRSWLFRNPHPRNATQRLERTTDPKCNCWEPDHKLLVHYSENELWWTGAVLEPVNVEELDRSARNAAIVGVVFERDGTARLIDRAGAIHDELEPTRYYLEIVLVREGAKGAWRLRSVSDVRPVPGEEEEG